MESKLLKGGKTVFDRTAEQEAALRQKERDLLEQRDREAFVAGNISARLPCAPGSSRRSLRRRRSGA